MKGFLKFAAFLFPFGLLMVLRLQPELDIVLNQPLFHFYIVTFTAFAAAVISILLTATLGEVARPRHLLAASAFGVMGTVFFSHGIATPNALIDFFHPAVQWSAWITLLLSGFIFSIAGFDSANGFPRWLPIRRLLTIVIALVVIYLGIAAFAHELLDVIGTQVAPWHRLTIFYLTLVVWTIATIRFAWIWRETRERVDGALTFVSMWLFFATISLHSFQIWQLSWWTYHFLMLISFLVTVIVLVREYEQARRFQLTRYYLAVSLIFTAFLALIASNIFANYSFLNLSARTKADANLSMQTLIGSMGMGLSPTGTDVATLIAYAELLERQPLGDFLLIFRTNGNFFYPFDEYDEPTPIPQEYRLGFDQALSGEIYSEIIPPGESAVGYEPTENSHTLLVYAPLYRAEETQPIGVVQTVRSVPELTNSIITARITGLSVAAITMGILFFALLLVIRRADSILTTRSQELEKAYADLKRAETLRDDMTNMIVHDLRNPISAIFVSLDFIEQSDKSNATDTGKKFTGIAKSASQKMMGLVDDILTVSKFEAGELKLNLENTPVSQVITKSLDGFRSQSEAERKQLGYHCPEITIPMDSVLITRVLDNLIANALKYTDEDTGIIEVLVQTEKDRVFFHVRDNGEGIPDEFKKAIFDKFKQVPTNGSERKGTGLGLTFCRMVVETHGGEIKVQDAPDGGSEFVFWIPERNRETKYVR